VPLGSQADRDVPTGQSYALQDEARNSVCATGGRVRVTFSRFGKLQQKFDHRRGRMIEHQMISGTYFRVVVPPWRTTTCSAAQCLQAKRSISGKTQSQAPQLGHLRMDVLRSIDVFMSSS
jgi:hypothetical protein